MSVRSGSDWLAGWLRPIDIFLALTMSLVRSPALCCGFVVYSWPVFLFEYDIFFFLGGGCFLLPMSDFRS